MLTLLKIQDFMSKALRGDTDVPPSVLSEFAEECRSATADQLSRSKGEWRIRMSGLGRPVCQQILDKHGVEESMSYNTLFRFLFGDITESIVMLIMKEAGVDIVDYQRPVELDLDGVVVKGTLDVILRDETGQEKVWDIKSASDYAFKSKFTGFEGYEGMKKDDPFGYVMQGFLYSEAVGLPFGGWIVVNKSSGEVAVVEVPDWSQEDKHEYLEEAKRRVKILTDPNVKPFKPFPDTFETYKRKGEVIRTGNKVLAKECNLCGYRHHCWPVAKIHPKVTSAAKSPPKVWYTRLKNTEI
jgi:hypothetical protein